MVSIGPLHSTSSVAVVPREPSIFHHHHQGEGGTGGQVRDEEAAAFLASSVATVERLLNYRFKSPDLLAESLTHSSYGTTTNYQRLEFLGDAALGLAISNYLFLTNPSSPPGTLSALRDANISTEKQARAAVRHGLYPLLLRDAPELDLAVRAFCLSVLQSHGGPGHASFGGPHARAPKVLADLVEAVAGAVYVDCGFDLERMWVVVRGLLEPIITVEDLDEQPVARLHELCQKRGMGVSFRSSAEGRNYVVDVMVDGKVVGVGSSEQKNIAKMNAARDALPRLWEQRVEEREFGRGRAFPVPVPMQLDDKDEKEEETEEREGKRRLNELCSKNHWPKPDYSVEMQKGSASEKGFRCSVSVVNHHGKFVASGDFKSRVKEAENNAACKLLKQLEQ